MTKKILMVCMGNICRSPIAEAVMRRVLERRRANHEWSVDSCALVGYHSGSQPEERALAVLKNHRILYSKEARVINHNDFTTCDYIFGMDSENVSALRRMAPSDCIAQIMLLGEFGLDENNKIIHDPYYFLGEKPFEDVYEQCVIACEAFVEQIVLGSVN